MKPLLLAAGVAVVLVVLLFAGVRLGYIPWPWTSSMVSQTAAAPQPAAASTPTSAAVNQPAPAAPSDANDEKSSKPTWIAACYDGRTLQFNQTLGGKGSLYLDMGDGDYQGIALVQYSLKGDVICSVDDSVVPPGGEHFLKVCADKENNIITVKYKDPVGKKLSIDDSSPYCKAAVTVH